MLKVFYTNKLNLNFIPLSILIFVIYKLSIPYTKSILVYSQVITCILIFSFCYKNIFKKNFLDCVILYNMLHSLILSLGFNALDNVYFLVEAIVFGALLIISLILIRLRKFKKKSVNSIKLVFFYWPFLFLVFFIFNLLSYYYHHYWPFFIFTRNLWALVFFLNNYMRRVHDMRRDN